jgi:hypothetical protein
MSAGLVVCAWGNHGTYRNRDIDVRHLLRQAGVKLHYLKLSKTGQPGHPLYIGYDVKPVAWEGF